MTPPRVLLVQSGHCDHFAGIDAELASLGLRAERAWPEPLPPRVEPGTGLVMVHELESARSLRALALARRHGVPTALLMDGIVEWRNMFRNPKNAADFLSPAPVDLILCAGEIDRLILSSLGNSAVATGLPRMEWAKGIPDPDAAMPPRILIATARTPCFNDRERATLLDALAGIRDAARSLRVTVVWRLTQHLDEQLGVSSDGRSLSACLADVHAVLTTPSTLALEAMLARRPTGLIHPFETPLWPAAAVVLGQAEPGDGLVSQAVEAAKHAAGFQSLVMQDAASAIRAVLSRRSSLNQQRATSLMCAGGGSAGLVARALQQMLAAPASPRADRPIPSPIRLPAPRPRMDRPRVVNCVYCDSSPVGGVTTWAARFARAMRTSPYDVRTLLIAAGDHALPGGIDSTTTSVCRIDPTDDQAHLIATMREAIERIEPDIVLPNYCDAVYAAAMQIRARGVRVVAIAHTHDAYYHRLVRTYKEWDAGVAVSAACMAWMRPLAEPRPIRQIVYGVPVADAPRRVPPTGTIQIGYVGRMSEQQKRMSDLLTLIARLNSHGVDFHFHLIGDGPALQSWLDRYAGRSLPPERLSVHGRRPVEWVERFLPTLDVSVLTSEYEGTSVTMLESMAAGVVPVVTRVSGSEEWIRHGESGFVVDVGDMEQMAECIRALAFDRARLADMSRRAWETIASRDLMREMCDAYAGLFDEVLARPIERKPTDSGLRLIDDWRWVKSWADDPAWVDAEIERALREAGYRSIVRGKPTAGADAVIIDNHDLPGEDRIAQWRARGIGVVVSPHLSDGTTAHRLLHGIEQATAVGCSRVAVFGIGLHTSRAADALAGDLPLIGFIDDKPPESGTFLGRPVVAPEHALDVLKPDAVVLSSDAWERHLWQRSEPWRQAGIRVIPLYGNYEAA